MTLVPVSTRDGLRAAAAHLLPGVPVTLAGVLVAAGAALVAATTARRPLRAPAGRVALGLTGLLVGLASPAVWAALRDLLRRGEALADAAAFLGSVGLCIAGARALQNHLVAVRRRREQPGPGPVEPRRLVLTRS